MNQNYTMDKDEIKLAITTNAIDGPYDEKTNTDIKNFVKDYLGIILSLSNSNRLYRRRFPFRI